MIDLHAHIIPGVDDGAADWATALRMAQCAAAAGTTDLVATPHVSLENSQVSVADIRQLTLELQQRLRSEGCNLRVHPGAEVMIAPDLGDGTVRSSLTTLGDGGLYLLVELPMGEVPIYAEEVIFQLSLQGTLVVIAHPERNAVISRRPEAVYPLIDRGALLQVTAGSLTGLFGESVRHAALRLCREGLVHFLGSDAHGLRKRTTDMSAAREVLRREVGAERALEITSSNGQTVLAGAPLDPPIVPENPSIGAGARDGSRGFRRLLRFFRSLAGP